MKTKHTKLNTKKSGLGKNRITFMLIPHYSSSKVFKFDVSRWALWMSCIIFIACTVSFAGTFYFLSGESSAKISNYSLKKELKQKESQLDQFNEENQQLRIALQELRERDQELRSLLGLVNPYRATKTARLVKKKKRNRVSRGKIPTLIEGDIQKQFDVLNKEVQKSKQSYEVLYASINRLKDKFDYVPSIWPIYGRILSGYGWRRHPIFGRSEFHRGIDIPSFKGADIKATAKGRVSFSGFAGGYGKTIVVDHKYGFTTIYAHNSRLLVKQGEYVNKGQVIAEIGSTGLSTGPHIHYEIRRWKKAIRPNKYLNMDIFTASREIW